MPPLSEQPKGREVYLVLSGVWEDCAPVAVFSERPLAEHFVAVFAGELDHPHIQPLILDVFVDATQRKRLPYRVWLKGDGTPSGIYVEFDLTPEESIHHDPQSWSLYMVRPIWATNREEAIRIAQGRLEAYLAREDQATRGGNTGEGSAQTGA